MQSLSEFLFDLYVIRYSVKNDHEYTIFISIRSLLAVKNDIPSGLLVGLSDNRWIFFINHFDLQQKVMLQFTWTKREREIFNYNGYQYANKRAQNGAYKNVNLSVFVFLPQYLDL
jgi:hypothetical protein